MSEYNQIGEPHAGHVGNELADLLDGLSNRISDTVESIAELADEVEELSSEIKSLLDDLRIVQSRIGQHARDKLDPLIDQLEGVYRELETAVWTMDCVTEGLPEDTDLSEIVKQTIDSVD
ncbi:MAG: hypothetical protein JSW66_12865 [Phycisphaerales bacterium]|nr:MAG: hypothetical protein JSW66_12865 [Phycisphaerales bacterium]